MTGAAKNTVTKLLVDLGEACAEYQDASPAQPALHRRSSATRSGRSATRSRRTSPSEHQGTFGYGDVWTWTAIDADTKLVPSWLVGERTRRRRLGVHARPASRLANRVQLTTDGHQRLPAGRRATRSAATIDYAHAAQALRRRPDEATQRRYSPAECIGTETQVVTGDPDPSKISTQLRRAAEPHDADGHAPLHPADERLLKEGREPRARRRLHFMHYNFARVHQTLRATDHARDGSRRRRSRLDAPRDRGPARLKQAPVRGLVVAQRVMHECVAGLIRLTPMSISATSRSHLTHWDSEDWQRQSEPYCRRYSDRPHPPATRHP